MEWTFGTVLWSSLVFFFWFAVIWIYIAIIADIFRRNMSGWAKAGWIFLLLVLPFLGALIYLIARGEGMRDRTVREQADMRRHMDAYIRETAGTGSSVDELAKLSELKDKGAISDEEFERAKAKLLA